MCEEGGLWQLCYLFRKHSPRDKNVLRNNKPKAVKGMRLQHLGVLFLALSLLACDTAEEPGPASSSGETSPPASSTANDGEDAAPMDSRWRSHLTAGQPAK